MTLRQTLTQRPPGRLAVAMGLDLLEIYMRIEEDVGVAIPDVDWESLSQRRRTADVTGGELLALVCRKKRICRQCGYDLRGHDATGRCPECGQPFYIEDDSTTWRKIQNIVGECLKVDPSEVTTDRLLIQDLGMG